MSEVDRGSPSGDPKDVEIGEVELNLVTTVDEVLKEDDISAKESFEIKFLEEKTHGIVETVSDSNAKENFMSDGGAGYQDY